VGPRSNLEKKETKIVGSNLGNFIFMMWSHFPGRGWNELKAYLKGNVFLALYKLVSLYRKSKLFFSMLTATRKPLWPDVWVPSPPPRNSALWFSADINWVSCHMAQSVTVCLEFASVPKDCHNFRCQWPVLLFRLPAGSWRSPQPIPHFDHLHEWLSELGEQSSYWITS
jgi:hypothetical protein